MWFVKLDICYFPHIEHFEMQKYLTLCLLIYSIYMA